MYRIGEFSKLTRTTVKTLRFYDEMDLLKPSEVDVWTGYRLYSTRQLYPLQRILALRQAGLSVNEIKGVLSGRNTLEILSARKAELERDQAEAEERLRRLTCIINHLEEDVTMKFQAIVKQIPPYQVYVREGTVKTYAEITPFILSAGSECLKANPDLQTLDPGYTFISYLDGEFRETDISIRFAQAVQKAGKDTANVHFEQLPALDAVCVYHKGPYDDLGAAYAYALTWVAENGYRVAGLARECYIDGIWNKPDPQDWLTEIQIPVQKG